MNNISKHIRIFLSFFHKPFSKITTLQTFSYIACGGFVALFDIVLFNVFYYFILSDLSIHIFGICISRHVAAMYLPFPFGFLLGFLLSRYVVFHETNLKKSTSLWRYILLVICCQILNYLLIRVFIEYWKFIPVISKIMCTVLVAAFSYFSQKYFTFKVQKV